MIPLRADIKAKYFAWVLWFIIALNAYVFWIEIQKSNPNLEAFILHWGVIPRSLFSDPIGRAKTLLSAMYIHGGWLHILSNMLFLFIFGKSVEDQMGHGMFLLFYLIVGITANFFQAYLMPHSDIPLIGASGAIAGVLGAYFFYFPHSRIVSLIPLGFFITVREVPAFFFLGGWFIIQMFNGNFHHAGQSHGAIAWWAHAFGFIAGILLAPVFGKKTSAYR